jgi:hypothetical protein
MTYHVSFAYTVPDEALSPRAVRLLVEETIQDLLGTDGSEIAGLSVAMEVAAAPSEPIVRVCALCGKSGLRLEDGFHCVGSMVFCLDHTQQACIDAERKWRAA